MKCKTSDELIAFEEKIRDAFKDGKINCPIHLCGGNEQQLLIIFADIQERDYVLSTHRNHYHYLLKGGNADKLFKEICGDSKGCCAGNGRSMHIYDPDINFYTSAITSGMCSVACGIGLAIQHDYAKRKIKPHVYCFVGDGAEDSGYFIEAVRFAQARALPITFIIEDNDLAVESSKKDRWKNYSPVNAPNVMRYEYTRLYPHTGIGEGVEL